MKLAPFTYHAPTTLKQATAILADAGTDAAVLAGGQSLVPMLALRLAQPAHLVDINRITELTEVEQRNGILSIGAGVRQQQALVSEMVQAACPLLSAALPHVGVRETRSRGTVVGSLAHADPAAELPAVVVALDGHLVLRSARGERTIDASEFFLGPFMTARASDELVTELRLPVSSPSSSWVFLEIERGPFALVAIAAGLELDPDGRVADARLAYSGVGGAPLRAGEAEQVLRGSVLDDEVIVEAAESAARAFDPPSDVLASRAYRIRAARELTKDALRQAAARASHD